MRELIDDLKRGNRENGLFMHDCFDE